MKKKGVSTGTFSNAGTLRVDRGLYHAGGSSLAIGATLSNSGLVSIGDPNLGAATSVSEGGHVIRGTLMTGVQTCALPMLNILGPAPATLGKLNIFGDVLLQFASGAV